jgi:hypothetical protein
MTDGIIDGIKYVAKGTGDTKSTKVDFEIRLNTVVAGQSAGTGKPDYTEQDVERFVDRLNTESLAVRHYDAADSTSEKLYFSEVGTTVPGFAFISEGGQPVGHIRVGLGLAKQLANDLYEIWPSIEYSAGVYSLGGIILVRKEDLNEDRTLKMLLKIEAADSTKKVETAPPRLQSSLFKTTVVSDKPGHDGIVFTRPVVDILLQQLNARELPVSETWDMGGVPGLSVGHTIQAASLNAEGQLVCCMELRTDIANKLNSGTKVLAPALNLNRLGKKDVVKEGDIPEYYVLPQIYGFKVIDADLVVPPEINEPIALLKLPQLG